MKASEQFKATIKAYLDERASGDALFATAYAKPNKTIDECVNYILQQVQKQGYAGYTDDEVFGMAIHYYDEDTLTDIKPVNCRVVVNHVVELTEGEMAELRERAKEQYQLKCVHEEEAAARKRESEAKAKAQARAKAAKEMEIHQATLFDL